MHIFFSVGASNPHLDRARAITGVTRQHAGNPFLCLTLGSLTPHPWGGYGVACKASAPRQGNTPQEELCQRYPHIPIDLDLLALVLRTANRVPVVDVDVIGFAALRPVIDFRRAGLVSVQPENPIEEDKTLIREAIARRL
jgi:hypothetical protein